MPIDLRADIELPHCAVVDRLGNSLPFSKGILATSILATGIETPKAYEVARFVQERLRQRNSYSIDSDDLTAITAEHIGELVSAETAERYMLWRQARRIGRPIVVSMLGSSGVGKSTLATRLALRLGINRVVTSDAIREVLRTVIPNSVLPELHRSSYEEAKGEPEQDHASTYHRQARAVASACVAVGKRYVKEKRNVLFEGVHLLPGMMTQELEGMEEKPIVVELMLALDDENLHNARLSHRLVSEPSRDGTRHLQNFDVIRGLQRSMRDLAQTAGVPEYDVGSDEDLTQKIVKAIVAKALD